MWIRRPRPKYLNSQETPSFAYCFFIYIIHQQIDVLFKTIYIFSLSFPFASLSIFQKITNWNFFSIFAKMKFQSCSNVFTLLTREVCNKKSIFCASIYIHICQLQKNSKASHDSCVESSSFISSDEFLLQILTNLSIVQQIREELDKFLED